MKNIPNDIDNAFHCFYFSSFHKKYDAYLLSEYLMDGVNKYIIIHDRRNVNIKFGYDNKEKLPSLTKS